MKKNEIIDYLVGISYGDFDDKIKASSECSHNHYVKCCKLNNMMPSDHSSSWWAAENDKENPWIQVDLGSEFIINAISIQGRGDCNQFVTKFRIKWSNSDEKSLRHLDEFEGNSNNTTVVKRYFREPIRARIIRLYVLGFYGHPSLR